MITIRLAHAIRVGGGEASANLMRSYRAAATVPIMECISYGGEMKHSCTQVIGFDPSLGGAPSSPRVVTGNLRPDERSQQQQGISQAGP